MEGLALGQRRQHRKRRDHPASAGLGRDDPELSLTAGTERALGHFPHLVIEHPVQLLGTSTVATAWAAMPSRRPVKPSPSVVVALTLTRPLSMSAMRAMLVTMASRCGPMRGASQINVRSR